MIKLRWFTLVAALFGVLAGCNKSSDAPSAPAAATTNAPAAANVPPAAPTGKPNGGSCPRPQGDGPDVAVWDFLDAVRTGNDTKASEMLTPLARQKVAEQHLCVSPPRSDTARFEMGDVQMLAADGARVVVKWIDIDNGKASSDDVVWMVRKESIGWRIAGAAVPVFPGEPPLLMNFEDPEDMIHKQQMVRDEIRHRMEAEQGKSGSANATTTAPNDAPPASAAGPATSTAQAPEAAGTPPKNSEKPVMR